MAKYIRVKNIFGNVGLVADGKILVNVSPSGSTDSVYFGNVIYETGTSYMDIGPLNAGTYVITLIDLLAQDCKETKQIIIA